MAFSEKEKKANTSLSIHFFRCVSKKNAIAYVYLFTYFISASFLSCFLCRRAIFPASIPVEEWRACDQLILQTLFVHYTYIPHHFPTVFLPLSSPPGFSNTSFHSLSFVYLTCTTMIYLSIPISISSFTYFSHRKSLMNVWHCVSPILLLTCSPLYPVLIVECHSNDSKIAIHIHRLHSYSDRHKHAQWGRASGRESEKKTEIPWATVPSPISLSSAVHKCGWGEWGGPVYIALLASLIITGINDTRMHTIHRIRTHTYGLYGV